MSPVAASCSALVRAVAAQTIATELVSLTRAWNRRQAGRTSNSAFGRLDGRAGQVAFPAKSTGILIGE
jgi:hypothetical protein